MSMKELLVRAGLTKAELARRLGLSYQTVCNWKELPRYAEAYVLLWIEYNRYRP